MTKLHELGVADAAAAIRTGATTAEALADALLARGRVVTIDASWMNNDIGLRSGLAQQHAARRGRHLPGA